MQIMTVLLDKVGKGSFGVVAVAFTPPTQCGRDMAKIAVKTQTRSGCPSFEREIILLKLMRHFEGFPLIYAYQTVVYPQSFSLTLLGPSLFHFLQMGRKKFCDKTVVIIGLQILNLIEKVHSLGIIHRDIKPGNFLMGLPGTIGERKVHLIDFGLAKFYWDHKNQQHYPLTRYGSLVGTARYASLANHLGYRCSRRDDIVAIGYMILDFLLVSLPWEGLHDENRQARYRKIYKMKLAYPPDILTRGHPPEFCDFLRHAQELGYVDPPNYVYLQNLLKSVGYRCHLGLSDKLDWEKEGVSTSAAKPAPVKSPESPKFFEPIAKSDILSRNSRENPTIVMTELDYSTKKITVEELVEAERQVDNLCGDKKPSDGGTWSLIQEKIKELRPISYDIERYKNFCEH